jgi:hypothetical protein
VDKKPNHTVKLVFKETEDKKEGITFVNIFLEVEGREIDPELISGQGATLAETWGYEILGFIESYMREQLAQNQMSGYVLAAPKKKDMN